MSIVKFIIVYVILLFFIFLCIKINKYVINGLIMDIKNIIVILGFFWINCGIDFLNLVVFIDRYIIYRNGVIVSNIFVIL